MKKRILILLISLVTGLSAVNAGNSPSENLECLKVYIPKLLETELSGWDMSALENCNVSADVSFTIDEKGVINITAIKSDDEVYAGIIKKNMQNMHIDICAPVEEKTFHITLKYLRR